MIFKFFTMTSCFLSFFVLSGQNKDQDERVYFSSIAYLTDSVIKKEKTNTGTYEIYLKDVSNDKLKPLKNKVSGSGFFVSKERDFYLVTANHVAKNISSTGEVYFQNKKGEIRNFRLEDLTDANANWVSHPIADVSVIRLNIYEKDDLFVEKLGIMSIPYFTISHELSAPDRLQDLTILGFPLSLGISQRSVSPITKKLKPASDILYLKRFDNDMPNAFFLLDDPSISGFSGGAVMIIRESVKHPVSDERIMMSPEIVGLVHGTIKDKTGGFAAIVPAKFIAETIDLAPSFNGSYIYYYPNGKIWSERIYRNGLTWSVISNIDPHGKPQEMGTLKNGNGTLLIYDKEGNLESEDEYENGIYLGSNFKVYKNPNK